MDGIQTFLTITVPILAIAVPALSRSARAVVQAIFTSPRHTTTLVRAPDGELRIDDAAVGQERDLKLHE